MSTSKDLRAKKAEQKKVGNKGSATADEMRKLQKAGDK